MIPNNISLTVGVLLFYLTQEHPRKSSSSLFLSPVPLLSVVFVIEILFGIMAEGKV
jgi:hypothetical protein